MDNCVCCPLGKVVDIFNFFKGEEKQKEKTSWVECGASRVEEGGKGAREHCSFYLHIIKELN